MNIKKFNSELNPEKLEKLKSLLEKNKKDWEELETMYKDQGANDHIGKASKRGLKGIASVIFAR